MEFLILFVVLSIVNVTFSTIRSIVTIKGGKLAASLISGGYFAFYNIMLIYTVADFPMWQKCVITFICNVIGVYIVKWMEERLRKDKLWKVEATIPARYFNAIQASLKDVPHSYIRLGDKHIIFNFYCATQKESAKVRDTINQYEAKYFVSETKIL
jgi:uncharacterized protein YebE (UPF0316 family)